MARTQPRDRLNQSSSSISLSEVSEFEDEDEDIKIEKIFSEEISKYEVLDVLPPTPQCLLRPESRSSVFSNASKLSTPQKKGSSGTQPHPSKKIKILPPPPSNIGDRKSKRNKRSEQEICKGLGFDLDDSEIHEINNLDDVDRPRVDNVIDDLLNLGMGKKKTPGGVRDFTAEQEHMERQFEKLRVKAPLEINGDGRCDMLKEDVTTLKDTVERVDALITVLESVRKKLIESPDILSYTEPPWHVAKKSEIRKIYQNSQYMQKDKE